MALVKGELSDRIVYIDWVLRGGGAPRWCHEYGAEVPGMISPGVNENAKCRAISSCVDRSCAG